ncbi:type III PLP-dependent enzyme [Mycolicibacterium vaccae]|uniref:ornithine decarboxylase n=1 Tax=Mycolicibacterium vaccae ATCC 25954 TaxID=1194972 RepID=K0UJG0_MYCVA|nr:type III PLP-dependent enzyme [Mycolicibacterium vaccae]ANI41767.1 diaminopimelate decarboxylase [Mycolicibacterium vaccae 95051]EJZ06936.1 ornithine decarboxylase [Mycolicibacterium vaccae ATCC 25954]MCV7059543.1 type III PLP-dependent enzyme [Mycolicibacterium vaccae]
MNPLRRSQLRDELRDRGRRWSELARTHGTPVLILEPHLVARRFDELRAALPGFGLHYAVKALPHPIVLSTIAICGGGFDVATRGEIEMLQQLGLPLHRCIHTNPIKKPADIDHAYAAGVRTFVVENPCEAEKFTDRPDDVELLVRLAFRNPGAKSDLSTKFGVEPADAELMVKHLLTTGVRFAGFSFHVGSQGDSAEPYRHALRQTLELATHLQHSLGVPTRVIDIGGGFPVSYRDAAPTVGEIGAAVDDVLGDRRGQFELLAEPGRFLAADCMTLLTSVVGSAERDGQLWHYLDDGLYGSYSNVMTEDVHPPILAVAELTDAEPALEPVTLAGPTCDSADVIARRYPMPALGTGDLLISPMMGAYTSVTASRFNGIAPTPVVMA